MCAIHVPDEWVPTPEMNELIMQIDRIQNLLRYFPPKFISIQKYI